MIVALALLVIPFLLYWITTPEPEDYARCRGLDKVED